jgi:Flp pilus assembly protein TadG
LHFGNRVRSQDGQTLIVAALCFPVLLGFLGLAADVGILTIAREKVQSAADSAAIAGAAELNYGDYTTAAQAAAVLNGFTNGTNGTTVSVNPSGDSTPTPLYGAYAGQAGYLEVVVTQSQPTYFMSVFGFSSMTVSGRAVAGQGRNPNCIYLLQSSGTTLTMNNGAELNSPSCGLVDDSSSSTAVSVSDGSSLTASSVEVVGSSTGSNGTVSPTPVTGIVPVSDPLAYLSPPSYTASSCTGDPAGSYQGGSTYNVGPGSSHSTTQNGNLVCYTSLTLGGNGNTVTVNPGIYVITGTLSLTSGTVRGGNGVTFYLVGSGSVNLANGTTFNFTAPTSGTYDGILFYQDRADTQTATIEGGATSTMQGILYFPKAALTLGNGSATTFYTPIIAASLTMYGGANFTDDDYSTVNPSSPLTSPRLVE